MGRELRGALPLAILLILKPALLDPKIATRALYVCFEFVEYISTLFINEKPEYG